MKFTKKLKTIKVYTHKGKRYVYKITTNLLQYIYYKILLMMQLCMLSRNTFKTSSPWLPHSSKNRKGRNKTTK